MYACDLLPVIVISQRVFLGGGGFSGGALLFLAEVAETALRRLRRGFILSRAAGSRRVVL